MSCSTYINFFHFNSFRFPNLRAQVPAINHAVIIANYYLDAIAFLVFVAGLTVYIGFSILRKLPIRIIPKKTKND